jgi:hypothetical protein
LRAKIQTEHDAAAGRSIDDVVRPNGQWLIKLRDVAPKD